MSCDAGVSYIHTKAPFQYFRVFFLVIPHFFLLSTQNESTGFRPCTLNVIFASISGAIIILFCNILLNSSFYWHQQTHSLTDSVLIHSHYYAAAQGNPIHGWPQQNVLFRCPRYHPGFSILAGRAGIIHWSEIVSQQKKTSVPKHLLFRYFYFRVVHYLSQPFFMPVLTKKLLVLELKKNCFKVLI